MKSVQRETSGRLTSVPHLVTLINTILSFQKNTKHSQWAFPKRHIEIRGPIRLRQDMKCIDLASGRQRSLCCYITAFVWGTLSLFLAGCSEDTGRIPFSGKIAGLQNFQGTISFRPAASDTNLPVTSERVENGSYAFTRENGPFPGEYAVIIERHVPLRKGASAQEVLPQRWRFQRTVPSLDQRHEISSDFTLDASTQLTATDLKQAEGHE